MNAKFFGLLLSLSLLVAKAQNNTKVLFIGNSITYYNNMPQTFEAIANSLGDPTEITSIRFNGISVMEALQPIRNLLIIMPKPATLK